MISQNKPAIQKASLPIFIIDDHPVYGESLYEYLKTRFCDHPVFYFNNSVEALERIPKTSLEGVLIMDINLPDISGIKLSEQFIQLSPLYRVIYCTALEASSITIERDKLLKHSFIFKDEPVDNLVECLKAVIQGRRHHSSRCCDINTSQTSVLTKKQMATLLLLKAGLSYQDIADQTGVSLNTTKSHLKSIYQKLDADNRTDCLIKAEKLNLFTADLD